jgi:1-acyl-sn-glycerol-3-phosphate acyltransferase
MTERPEITANDSYVTPDNVSRYKLDRILFNSRWVFLSKFLHLVFTSRSAARNGIYDTHMWVETSHRVFTFVERCGGRIHITGLDHIRFCNEPVVFVSNHMSTLETMILPGIIQPLKDIAFVVKKDLVTHWAFGDVMRSRNPIVLDRVNPRNDLQIVLQEGAARLAGGISIVMFPQSTRRAVFDPADFNSLGTKLAARTGVSVIPIALKTDFWGHGKTNSYIGPIYRQNTVHLAFGAPVRVSGSGRTEHQELVDFIGNHLKSWTGRDI